MCVSGCPNISHDGWMTQEVGDLHEGNSGGYASSVRPSGVVLQ